MQLELEWSVCGGWEDDGLSDGLVGGLEDERSIGLGKG